MNCLVHVDPKPPLTSSPQRMRPQFDTVPHRPGQRRRGMRLLPARPIGGDRHRKNQHAAESMLGWLRAVSLTDRRGIWWYDQFNARSSRWAYPREMSWHWGQAGIIAFLSRLSGWKVSMPVEEQLCAGRRANPGPVPHAGVALSGPSRSKSPDHKHPSYWAFATQMPLDGRRYSASCSKNASKLKPLTESNRRPSPYHGSLYSSATPGRSPDQRKHERTLALTSAERAHAGAICHSI